MIQSLNPNKQAWETKFENFLAEGGALEPLVNNEDKVKYNSKEQDEKIKADPKLKFEMDNKLGGSYKELPWLNYPYSYRFKLVQKLTIEK